MLRDEDKITTSSLLNNLIWAELPDPESPNENVRRLHSIVGKCMIHGPCKPGSRCMKADGQKCSYKYPKAYSNTTTIINNGYPILKRPMNMLFVIKENQVMTNQHVVPYNPYLTLKFNYHINVELCASIVAVKYFFKYLTKGSDCAKLHMTNSSTNNNNPNTGPSVINSNIAQNTLNYDEIKSFVGMLTLILFNILT
jgi:hypothetical protein